MSLVTCLFEMTLSLEGTTSVSSLSAPSEVSISLTVISISPSEISIPLIEIFLTAISISLIEIPLTVISIPLTEIASTSD